MSSERITINDARAQLGDLVIRVREAGERITLTRYGTPAAVLVTVDDAARLDAIDAAAAQQADASDRDDVEP